MRQRRQLLGRVARDLAGKIAKEIPQPPLGRMQLRRTWRTRVRKERSLGLMSIP
ncbi:hypothetical protein N184_05490 [Sinorhizobium sp. GL28]|nr:hypothetical protein N184_05490 [Sinorhizobium sp. GL28]